VLSEEFSHLKKDVQQSLMFYDLKHQVVVASVEIIFDNTDRRLPVSLRHIVIKVLILDYMQRTLVYCQSVP
jgi:chromosome segregation ATPase